MKNAKRKQEETQIDAEVDEGAHRLAEELKSFVPSGALANKESTSELQLAICRKLREVSYKSDEHELSSSELYFSFTESRFKLYCLGPI
jgi:hypothetical protein